MLGKHFGWCYDLKLQVMSRAIQVNEKVKSKTGRWNNSVARVLEAALPRFASRGRFILTAVIITTTDRLELRSCGFIQSRCCYDDEP